MADENFKLNFLSNFNWDDNYMTFPTSSLTPENNNAEENFQSLDKTRESLLSWQQLLQEIMSGVANASDVPSVFKIEIDRILRSLNIKNEMPKNEEETETLNETAQATIEVPRIAGLNEIAGLHSVKRLLKCYVLLPLKQPQLFINHKIFNSILLYGPPGTGKTHLVHALAYESNAVLHCVNVSSICSPLVGKTEKNIKNLFDHFKKCRRFSILFIDEIDGMCKQRDNSEQDHTRRMKTEIMCQMSQMENMNNFILICATNCPWDIDTAIMRRFQKRIYIPLPDNGDRWGLFKLFTKNIDLNFEDNFWHVLVRRTDGFSGSDIANIVQSAIATPIMELEDTKIWKLMTDGFYEPMLCHAPDDKNMMRIVCNDLYSIPPHSVRCRKVEFEDFLKCLDEATPTVSKKLINKYKKFQQNK